MLALLDDTGAAEVALPLAGHVVERLFGGLLAEQSLGNKQCIKVKRSVKIRRIVMVVTLMRHPIDKPAVHTLIEMRRLDVETGEPQRGADGNDENANPRIDRLGR